MNYIPNNCLLLRKENKLTQAEISRRLGIPTTTYASWEYGKAEPNADNLLKLCEIFVVTPTDFMMKNLSNAHLIKKTEAVNNKVNAHLNAHGNAHLNDKKGAVTTLVSEPETAYGEEKYNVYDLDSMAAAGMALFISEIDKRKIKPTLYFPWLGPGIHIRIGIGGDSMHPTIKDQDKTISTWIPEIDNLREGNVHIIFDKDDGIVCKRIYRHHTKNTFEFISDNEVHKPYTRHLSDILAIFRISEVITTDLRPANAEINKEVRQLRADVNEIKHLLGRK